MASALGPESRAPRGSAAAYCRRRSRVSARETAASSSTVSITGFAGHLLASLRAADHARRRNASGSRSGYGPTQALPIAVWPARHPWRQRTLANMRRAPLAMLSAATVQWATTDRPSRYVHETREENNSMFFHVEQVHAPADCPYGRGGSQIVA